MIKLREERDLFGRFLIIHGSRPGLVPRIEDTIGHFEVSVVPRSLFATDGSLLIPKDKYKLMHAIEAVKANQIPTNGSIDGHTPPNSSTNEHSTQTSNTDEQTSSNNIDEQTPPNNNTNEHTTPSSNIDDHIISNNIMDEEIPTTSSMDEHNVSQNSSITTVLPLLFFKSTHYRSHGIHSPPEEVIQGSHPSRLTRNVHQKHGEKPSWL